MGAHTGKKNGFPTIVDSLNLTSENFVSHNNVVMTTIIIPLTLLHVLVSGAKPKEEDPTVIQVHSLYATLPLSFAVFGIPSLVTFY